MFTGIIKNIGKVMHIEDKQGIRSIQIETALDLSNTHMGDSIAVNGTCLTITAINQQQISFDIVAETLQKTNLSLLEKNRHVNLEPVMTLQAGIHGHLVQGHVDGTTRIKSIAQQKDNIILTIALNEILKNYLIAKGSICIDGISLTIADIKQDYFTIAIIPHTWQQTIIQYYQTNQVVNYEIDMMAKYIHQYMEKIHAKL